MTSNAKHRREALLCPANPPAGGAAGTEQQKAAKNAAFFATEGREVYPDMTSAARHRREAMPCPATPLQSGDGATTAGQKPALIFNRALPLSRFDEFRQNFLIRKQSCRIK